MVRETSFDDVFDSQATFRAMLDCLSRPGTIRTVPEQRYESAPLGFVHGSLPPEDPVRSPSLFFDRVSHFEAGLGSLSRDEPVDSFRRVAEADYVLFEGSTFDEDFSRLNRGTLEFPESSATAFLGVHRLLVEKQLPARELRVTGPGVRGVTALSVTGLDARYLEERSRANQFYPLGIDVFLMDADGRIAGIPRTSTVEVG